MLRWQYGFVLIYVLYNCSKRTNHDHASPAQEKRPLDEPVLHEEKRRYDLLRSHERQLLP